MAAPGCAEKGSRRVENAKGRPMRSSIRIAKKRSIETCCAFADGGRKVLENSTNKVDFMSRLNLKKEKNKLNAGRMVDSELLMLTEKDSNTKNR